MVSVLAIGFRLRKLLNREKDLFVVGLFQNSAKIPPSERYIFLVFALWLQGLTLEVGLGIRETVIIKIGL